MEGYGYKNYVTVIMDGSDKGKVRHITNLFDMATDEQMYGFRASCRPLDSRHPTMIVIESMLPSDRDYEVIRRMIESIYPGLCVFNPQI